MALPKALQPIFRQIDTDEYGPRRSNPVYEVAIKGVTYRVSRKRWSLPSSAWGWKATAPSGEELYGDTLMVLADSLGFDVGLV